jgi:hypothetical protein
VWSSGAVDKRDDKEVSVKTKSPANFLKQWDGGYWGACRVRGALHILSENTRVLPKGVVETCIST